MSLDRRRFYVSGLRFGVDECHNQLMIHFSQFGELSCQMFTCTPMSNISSNLNNGFLEVEEPILCKKTRETQNNRGYAIICFSDEKSADDCANFGSPHQLSAGYEIKVQRIVDMTKSSLSSKLPSHRIYVSFMGIRSMSELALKTAFEEFGTITKVEFVGDEPGESCSSYLQMAYIEFQEKDAVDKIISRNHCVGGYRVKVRRGLRTEDLKMMAQKERERDHKEQWMKQKAAEAESGTTVRDYGQPKCHGYFASSSSGHKSFSYPTSQNNSIIPASSSIPSDYSRSQMAGYAAASDSNYGYPSEYDAPPTSWGFTNSLLGSNTKQK